MLKNLEKQAKNGFHPQCLQKPSALRKDRTIFRSTTQKDVTRDQMETGLNVDIKTPPITRRLYTSSKSSFSVL